MTAIKPTVLYFSRFVPDYRLPIFRALDERLGGRLVICSGDPPESSSLTSLISESSQSTGPRRFHLKNRWLGGEKIHWQSWSGALKEYHDASALLIEESPRSVSLPFLMRAARKRKMATALWGHFSSNNRPLGSGDFRDSRRMNLARSADTLICYTDEIASDLRTRLGQDNIFVARNTLDTSILFAEHDRLSAEGKLSIRQRLGIADRPTLLFIGRLIKEKGVERVLEVASKLGGEKVSVIVIGDGPERTNLEKLAADLNISALFTGAIADLKESAPYIAASDVLLNPGYLGLSVNHAFSLGVPVVAPRTTTSDVRGHSPEWAYVSPGETGEFAASDSIEDLSASTLKVLCDQSRYSRAAAAFSRSELSLERMVDGLEQAIEFAETSAKSARGTSSK